jgi:Tat protein secretion system quality control protein TatD with DNase activity
MFRCISMRLEHALNDAAIATNKLANLQCNRTIIAALGLHPWRAVTSTTTASEYLSELRQYLVQHPRAIVGEIGLDKAAKVRTLLVRGGLFILCQ